jgi:hypothetical protein
MTLAIKIWGLASTCVLVVLVIIYSQSKVPGWLEWILITLALLSFAVALAWLTAKYPS